MQIYAIRLHNFMRYGDIDNSLVFDVPEDQKAAIAEGTSSLDEAYDKVMENPIEHIAKIKKGEIEFIDIVSIAGIIGGDPDQSNGAGKSTILEGICYAIYDKVVRKSVNTDKKGSAGVSTALRLNGEFAEGMKQSYVEILFEVDGNIYIAKRGREFSKSRTTGKPSSSDPFFTFDWINAPDEDDKSQSGHRKANTNESILQAVGMDYDVFVNSIMFAQSDAGKFLTGSDKTRKEMFVSLLMLEDIIQGCLKDIREDKNKQKDLVNKLVTEASVLEEIIKKHQTTLILELAINDKEEEVKAAEKIIDKIDGEIGALTKSDEVKRVASIKEEGKKIQDELKGIDSQKEEQIKVWREHYANTKSSIESKTGEIDLIGKRESRAKAQIEAKEKSIAEFDLKKNQDELDKSRMAKDVLEKYQVIENTANEKQEKFYSERVLVSSVHLQNYEKEIGELKTQLDNAGEKSEFVCEHCKSVVSKEHLETQMASVNSKKEKVEIELAGHKKEHKVLQNEFSEAKERTEKLKTRIGQELELTTRIKNNEEDKSKITELHEEIKSDVKAREGVEVEIVSLKEKLAEYELKGKEVKTQFEEKTVGLKEKMLSLKKELDEAEASANDVQGKIDKLKSQKEEENAKKTKALSSIGEMKRVLTEIAETKKSLEEQNKKVKKAEVQYHRLLVLEEICGLEGIQARFTQKYLPLFNDHVKEVLDILTDGKVGMELTLNDSSKIDMSLRGGLGETFDLISGGERMLIRLGTDIAMGLLKFSRTTSKAEMIALDEIFGPLDNSHSEAVFSLLEVLKSKFKRVIVISHKDEISKKIPHRILVEKDPGEYGLSKIKSIV